MAAIERYEVLAVGSGEAGKYLAWTLSKAGHRTALIERSMVGGSCPNVACLPSKNIIHSAKVAALAARAAEVGLPGGAPAIGMNGVQDRKRRMVEDHFRIVRDNLAGGRRTTRDRLVPFCMFTDPELARVGLNETQAKSRGIEYRLAKMPMAAVLRTRTLSEPRGFVKMLVDNASDRILGFAALGAEANELTAAVQTAMLGGLPFTVLRDASFTHPTAAEGLTVLLAELPSARPA